MLYKVDFTKAVYRYLYANIYDRLMNFGISQGNTEQDILSRILRLQAGDNTLVLLIELDNTIITSHCLINLINNTAYIEHCQTKPSKQNTFAQECIDYISNELKIKYPNINTILFSTTRNEYRAFEKKYGFSIKRIIMEKEIKPIINTESID